MERCFRIGGRVLCFHFSGPALVSRLTPALEHLAVPPQPHVDLHIAAWDSASTATPMLPPPWQSEELRVCGEIQSFIDAGCYTHYNVYHNALTLIDQKNRRAVYWIKEAEAVPDHETASPLFALFHAWMSVHGLHHVHAGAVGLPEGGVLLVGNCGSGKSSTALACLDSPLRFAGDDRCLLAAGPTPTVHSLYSTAKTHPQDIDRFSFISAIREELSYLQNGKALYFLERLFPGKMASHFPLQAILMPRVTGLPDTTLQPGSAAAGLLTLAPYTAIHWPSAGPKTFQTLAKVFKRVPCYQLNVGTDIEQIPAVILDLLKKG